MDSPLVSIGYCLAALALAALATGWRSVRHTTLVGPWGWLTFSVVAMACGLYWLRNHSGTGAAASVQLFVATLSLCPAICLLGAKRPQAGVWHFIVGTLWLVLILPGIQLLVMGKGGELDVHPARSWFLFLLWLVGLGNSLFSRYGWCLLLAAVGQAIWLSPFFPPAPGALAARDLSWGLVSYTGAILAVLAWSRRRYPATPLDRLWRDFRDAYGLVWTLRIAERLNATAQANGWNVAVTWQGFHAPDGTGPAVELSPEQGRALRQQLRNLLRRFVSDAWIAQRIEL